MDDYLEHEHDELSILEIDEESIDGTYAEGVTPEGSRYAIHAGGDGDSFNHLVTYEFLQ